ncbi:MAG: hypothetical protein ACKO2P_18150, partial [Planctomycetota bacterium]
YSLPLLPSPLSNSKGHMAWLGTALHRGRGSMVAFAAPFARGLPSGGSEALYRDIDAPRTPCHVARSPKDDFRSS